MSLTNGETNDIGPFVDGEKIIFANGQLKKQMLLQKKTKEKMQSKVQPTVQENKSNETSWWTKKEKQAPEPKSDTFIGFF